MSLFSRLDRLRTRDSQTPSNDEDGLFSVPDLAPTAPPSSVPAPANSPGAPGKSDDFGDAAPGDGESASLIFAPTGEAPAVSLPSRTDDAAPEKASGAPSFASASLDAAPDPKFESADDEAKPSMFATAPFKLPNQNQEPDADVAATETDAAEAAPALAAKPASPFERLMAARATQAQETPRPAPAKAEIPKTEAKTQAPEAGAAPATEAKPSDSEMPEIETSEAKAPEAESARSRNTRSRNTRSGDVRSGDVAERSCR